MWDWYEDGEYTGAVENMDFAYIIVCVVCMYLAYKYFMKSEE